MSIKGTDMEISVNAYAKINLFLDIDSLREDRYHNILSFMQSVTLHDTVTVKYESSDEKIIRIHTSDPSIPCNEKNLAYKAANLYPIANGEIDITIEKRIPMEAGLAGGSADAAATLVALNNLSSEPLSMDELKKLGNKLGADVPFCIETGACIAKGTGDILETAPIMPNFPIVIAKMGEGMSTPEAYRALDAKYNNFVDHTPKNEKLSVLVSTEPVEIDEYANSFYNIFESVVEPIRPNVTLLKSTVMENGAINAIMSGSGTSVFGVFKNEADAAKALSSLISLGANAHLCYPLNNG